MDINFYRQEYRGFTPRDFTCNTTNRTSEGVTYYYVYGLLAFSERISMTVITSRDGVYERPATEDELDEMEPEIELEAEFFEAFYTYERLQNELPTSEWRELQAEVDAWQEQFEIQIMRFINRPYGRLRRKREIPDEAAIVLYLSNKKNIIENMVRVTDRVKTPYGHGVVIKVVENHHNFKEYTVKLDMPDADGFTERICKIFEVDKILNFEEA